MWLRVSYKQLLQNPESVVDTSLKRSYCRQAKTTGFNTSFCYMKELLYLFSVSSNEINSG